MKDRRKELFLIEDSVYALGPELIQSPHFIKN